MKDKPYYFQHKTKKIVEVFEGGLFIFPVTEKDDWLLCIDGKWGSPNHDSNVKCHHCRKEFNLAYRRGLECHVNYTKYFCDASCRIRWHRYFREAVGRGALHVWDTTLYDERCCVRLWGV